MKIRTLTDKSEILAFLDRDRLYAAYAVGDLSAPLFAHCRWALAENGGEPHALALVYDGLQTPFIFVMGDAGGVGAILHDHVRLTTAYMTLRQEHAAVVSSVYSISAERQMWRMAVSRQTFRPAHRITARLHAQDLDAVNVLYSWGGPEFFAASQLASGVYYAVLHEGKPVAVAGTHLVSPEYGVAAVGNVYTAPDYRNRGYAAACVSSVVAELLDKGCRDVVLNVRQDNAAAVRAYAKLGFAVHCPFLETPGQRKGAVRRLMSRIRRSVASA